MCKGQTETLTNNHDPQFMKSFLIDYYFEKNQVIKVEIYDEDDKEHQLIGTFECKINKILTANRQTVKGDL